MLFGVENEQVRQTRATLRNINDKGVSRFGQENGQSPFLSRLSIATSERMIFGKANDASDDFLSDSRPSRFAPVAGPKLPGRAFQCQHTMLLIVTIVVTFGTQRRCHTRQLTSERPRAHDIQGNRKVDEINAGTPRAPDATQANETHTPCRSQLDDESKDL